MNYLAIVSPPNIYQVLCSGGGGGGREYLIERLQDIFTGNALTKDLNSVKKFKGSNTYFLMLSF